MKRAAVWRVVANSLKQVKILLAALAGLLGLAMALELAPPLLVQRLIDRHLAPGVGRGVWALAVGYLGALAAIQLIAFCQNYLTTVVGQHILLNLRQAVAERLRLLPVGYYDSTPVGEIMSRSTNDVESVNTLFSSGVVGMVTDTLKAVSIIIAMLTLNARLALVALIVLPLILAITEYFRRGIRTAERNTRRAVGAINAHFQESLAGARVIRAYGQKDRFRAMLDRALGSFLASTSRASLFNSFFPPAMDLLRACTIGALLWFGAQSAGPAGAVTIGTLVAFIQLVMRMFSPLTALSDEYQTIQQALAGVDRIDEVLRLEPEARPECVPLPARLSGRVEIAGLSFGYRPGATVLRNLDLTIGSGERVAIIGRTGAGKTTLMNVIAGVYAPGGGTVSISGLDPRRIRPEERRRLLGIVPQAIHLFEGTVRDNITLGDPGVSNEAVWRAADAAGLAAVVSVLPDGFDTRLGPGGTRLSHGQEQLLSLARAIVFDPVVLLLDEPTSGLDTETERALFGAIAAQSSARTTITISHRLSGVINANRVLVMADGRIVQDGTPDDLAQREGWYAVYRTLETLGWQEEAAAEPQGE